MELTIILSVSSFSENYDIIETLESLPWDNDGVDLIIYSKDKEKIKKIISEEDLERTIMDGKMNVVLCETQEEDSDHHSIGLEDAKTDGIMFLNSGDVIEDFQYDLLTTSVSGEIGLPGVGKEGIPETATCHECKTLPDSYRGIIFKTKWLKENNITKIDLGLMAKVCDLLKDKLVKENYWDGWGNYDISESLSITRTNDPNEKTIETLQNIWNSGKLSYSPYIRDLVWTRIMTSAARLITGDDISNFNKYLYPVQKTAILN